MRNMKFLALGLSLFLVLYLAFTSNIKIIASFKTLNNESSNEGQVYLEQYKYNKGDCVFLKVRSKDWLRYGDYTLKVSSINHVHIYEDYYEQRYIWKNNKKVVDSMSHIAYCHCGSSTIESHDFVSVEMDIVAGTVVIIHQAQ